MFYDTACAKCQIETALMPSIIAEARFPLDFYAIYVGEDKRDWKAFRRNFKLKGQDEEAASAPCDGRELRTRQ